MDDRSRPQLTIVLPAYNEAGVIGTTLDRIVEAMGGTTFEIVVVSDGSDDATFEEASDRLADHGVGTAIQLAKNVGSHRAIRAGLLAANGSAVAVMAADGQDPPESLPEMLDVMESGAEVVWGARRGREADPLMRRVFASIFYRTFRLLTGLNYPPKGYDFVLFTRPVLDAINLHRERNAPLFLLLYNIGFRHVEVDYSRGERIGGKSSWTLRKRARLAVDMVTAFSAAPIRAVSLIGGLIGLFGIVFGGITIVRALAGQTPIDGWASLMVVSSLMSGLTLLALALIGEYVWRALDEARGRPLFIEARRRVFDRDSGSEGMQDRAD